MSYREPDKDTIIAQLKEELALTKDRAIKAEAYIRDYCYMHDVDFHTVQKTGNDGEGKTLYCVKLADPRNEISVELNKLNVKEAKKFEAGDHYRIRIFKLT